MNFLSRWARTLDLGRTLRLLLEAAVIGALSGLSCAGVRLFFRLLQWSVTGHAGLLPAASEALPLWRRAITPALGGIAAMTVTFLLRKLSPRLHATGYVEAIRFKNGRISLPATVWRTMSAAFSVATGASIGREGSMIQFAAATVSFAGQRLRWIRLPLAQQVACGVAAAVAAAYQAPAAGVFFALEIVLGEFAWQAAPALAVAAFAGEAASRTILAGGPMFAAHGKIALAWPEVAAALAIAGVLGVLGPVYLWLLRSLRRARSLPLPLLWSGAVVGAASLISTRVWGNGDEPLLGVLRSPTAMHVLVLVLLLRLCTTVFCVGTGTVGGVFTPTLFAGGAAGLLLCQLAHGSHTMLFAVIGMGCLLAAVTHAPWMASFMAAELTGEWTIFPLMLVCNLVAWQIARRLSTHSLYAIASDLPAALPGPDLPTAGDPHVRGPVAVPQFEAAD